MMRTSINNSAATRDSDEVAAKEWIVQGSLALKMLRQNLRNDKIYAVLDLGPAIKENVDFYSNFARRIQIEDIYDSLSLANVFAIQNGMVGDVIDNNGNDKNFERILSYSKDTRFDLIFMWDLFNYLTREQLQKLVAYLSQFCNRRAVLFSLTTNSQYVADHPIGYKIVDEQTLTHPAIISATRINTRYKEPNLTKLMPSFKVDKTFLLRNGMQEHLFILGDE